MISCEPIDNGYRLYMGRSIFQSSTTPTSIESFASDPKAAFLWFRNKKRYELDMDPVEWDYVLEHGFDFEILFTHQSFVVGYKNDEPVSETAPMAHYYVSLENDDALHYKMFVELPK